MNEQEKGLGERMELGLALRVCSNDSFDFKLDLSRVSLQRSDLLLSHVSSLFSAVLIVPLVGQFLKHNSIKMLSAIIKKKQLYTQYVLHHCFHKS